MEENILISYFNDFIFCPASIYFHKLYGNLDTKLYQDAYQINGTNSHKSIDEKTYSTRKDVLQGIDIFSDEFGIQGKIDVFDMKSGILMERKNHVTKIYDGYVFQVYAQYYCLKEMGYQVKKIKIHSVNDNKNYDIKLPDADKAMDKKFKLLIKKIHEFNIENFTQTNKEKCKKCIYEPSCDRSLL